MRAREFRQGEIVGDRYELVEPVGKGGMAEVWRARDRRSGGPVAVKFLQPAEELRRQLDTQERQEDLRVLHLRFQQETEHLSRFDHPGIPRLHGQGTHRDVPYLVMELVEGNSLHEFLLLRRPLTLGPGVAIAAQIADALVCAHGQSVVHRDLKPQNVMLAFSGLVKLVDFGIAKQLGVNAPNYTRFGTTLGSLGYQAPEQLRWEPATPRTDVYALGCVCYEMFTGRAPFIETDNRPLQDQHLRGEPAPLGSVSGQVPEDLDDLVLRMLAKAPEDRPHMAEVSATLQCHLPCPGAPPPVPRLHPDPTRPFRDPRGVREERGDAQPYASAVRPAVAGGWLSVRGVEQDCRAAEAELARGEVGPALLRLAEIADEARKQWGPAKPLVRSVHRLAVQGRELLDDHPGQAPD